MRTAPSCAMSPVLSAALVRDLQPQQFVRVHSLLGQVHAGTTAVTAFDAVSSAGVRTSQGKTVAYRHGEPSPSRTGRGTIQALAMPWQQAAARSLTGYVRNRLRCTCQCGSRSRDGAITIVRVQHTQPGDQQDCHAERGGYRLSSGGQRKLQRATRGRWPFAPDRLPNICFLNLHWPPG